MKTILGIFIWIMMGVSGIGLGSQLNAKAELSVGQATFLMAVAPLTFILAGVIYVSELEVWSECVINCGDDKK